MAKPQKQLGKTMEMERIPIKNKERPWSNDKNTTKSENNKFQQKIKIKNGKELIQKFPTKEKLGNEYLKEHYKENDLAVFEINKNQNYVILAPSNINCSNKIMKDWPKDIINKDQLEVFGKDLRPMLCVKNIIINCGLHLENMHRLVKKNGNPITLVLFKLKNEGKEQTTCKKIWN